MNPKAPKKARELAFDSVRRFMTLPINVLGRDLVLLNIPFALIGGVFGLYFSGEYMSILTRVVMLNYFQ